MGEGSLAAAEERAGGSLSAGVSSQAYMSKESLLVNDRPGRSEQLSIAAGFIGETYNRRTRRKRVARRSDISRIA